MRSTHRGLIAVFIQSKFRSPWFNGAFQQIVVNL
jgi:hypothetical protein